LAFRCPTPCERHKDKDDGDKEEETAETSDDNNSKVGFVW
jgi:hypothetical protein